MLEARTNWSKQVDIVAQSVLRTPETVDPGLRFSTQPDDLKYGDPEYFLAIARVVNAAVYAGMPNYSRFISRIAGKTPGFMQFMRYGLNDAGENDIPNATRGWNVQVSRVSRTYLPETIENLARTPANEPVAENLAQVAQGLRGGDNLLSLRFSLDGWHGFLDRFGVNLFAKRKLIHQLAETGVPELASGNPKDLTAGLLDNIDRYGLGKYVSADLFFTASHRAQELGKIIGRSFSYSSAPRPDEAATKSYEERKRDWDERKDKYEAQKEVVAGAISKLYSQYTRYIRKESRSLYEGLNVDLLLSDKDKVINMMTEILDHPVTQSIIEDPEARQMNATISSPAPNFPGLVNGIKVVSEYAKTHPSKFGSDSFIDAVVAFDLLARGLYNIKLV